MPHPLLAPLEPVEQQRLVEQTGGTGVAGMLGVKIEHSEPDLLRASMTLRDEHHRLIGEARLMHRGRTTEVWDATVLRERDDRVIAYYRCTQALLAVPRESER